MLKTISSDPKKIQLKDKVLILYPPYVAGFEGIVLSQEKLSNDRFSNRWLIHVNFNSFMLSLAPQDFILLKDNNR
ncbi:hypothetical protein DSM106972_096050 [Dulcicalothrix desertica PCC 7102]|uniref:Uncharacterized protein n=1 Tax=Dulcicalothrix desertica PCC 7102 TaxID=232991 RepID=A0A433UHW4_9CYAN|nr:hypothetical protein [Dulcicalothrix desertica]RUS93456.1 hypothetical protein DSM106972_096050 [Dulcicalothrix desertica PCC 7102]TWH39684.1 hypothetical protein CAL7102_08937 [Dulcicalothrix desertica PCC 7102]